MDTSAPYRSLRLISSPEEHAVVKGMLQAQGFTLEPEPFHATCLRTRESRPPLGSTLAAFFGCIYIQDRASMLPPLALEQAMGTLRGAAVLDMCASPGGKTSFLAQLAGPQGFVLANEPNRDRGQTLRRNVTRMNLANTAVCHYPGEQLPLPDATFGAILLDPPCSGWGTAEKHPKVNKLWKGEKIVPLENIQRRLLQEASRLLAPGGRLVYSTCTTNQKENEEQVLWAMEHCGLEQHPLTPLEGLAFAPSPLPEVQGCLRIDQERSQAQGHFAACLGKPGATGDEPRHQGFLPGGALDPVMLQGPWQWERLGPGQVRRFGDIAHFVHQLAEELLPEDLRWQGLPLGRVGGGIFREFPRARLLLPPNPAHGDLVFDDPAPIQRLLTGQSLETGDEASHGTCGLYFRSDQGTLGLGWLRRKGRRALWSER